MNVFLSDEQPEPVDGPGMRRFAELTLEAEGLPSDTEMAVVLVDQDQMAVYNDRFMERSGATDVLAFPLVDMLPGSPPPAVPGDPPLAVGDVFLCPPVVRHRAAEEGVSFDDLLHLMLVHGVLHLLGYDHHDEASSERMAHREDELMQLVGRSIS